MDEILPSIPATEKAKADFFMSPSGRRLRGGGYFAIHKWLVKNYGSAARCENTTCKGISKRFHWALLKDKEYEHKRENFWELCSSCHRDYDYRPEWGQLISSKLQAHMYTPEDRLKISAAGKAAYSEGRRQLVHPKPVKQFTLAGDFIAKHPSTRQAAASVGISPASIRQACTSKSDEAGGFVWKPGDTND